MELDKALDVYAFAIITWELLTRERPWDFVTNNPNNDPYPTPATLAKTLIKDAVLRGERPLISPKMRLDAPILCNVIQACWHQNAQRRPPFSEILQRITSSQ